MMHNTPSGSLLRPLRRRIGALWGLAHRRRHGHCLDRAFRVAVAQAGLGALRLLLARLSSCFQGPSPMCVVCSDASLSLSGTVIGWPAPPRWMWSIRQALLFDQVVNA